MDEGRLAAVKKARNYNRKYVYVMNDIMKNRQEMYESCLTHEMQESRSRLVADLEATRRTVVRNKILLHCLNAGKKWTGPNSLSPYGAYGGRPIGAFSREIDRTIAWNHPRLRRLRKVEKMKESCLRHGAILDAPTVRQKMEDLFTKSVEGPNVLSKTSKKSLHDDYGPYRHHVTRSDIFPGRTHHHHFRPPQFSDPVSATGISLKLNPLGRLVGVERKVHNYDLQDQAFVADEQTTMNDNKQTDELKEGRTVPEKGSFERFERGGEQSDSLPEEQSYYEHNINHPSLGPHLAPLPPIPAMKDSQVSKSQSPTKKSGASSSSTFNEQNRIKAAVSKQNRDSRTRKSKTDGKEISLKFTSREKEGSDGFLDLNSNSNGFKESGYHGDSEDNDSQRGESSQCRKQSVNSNQRNGEQDTNLHGDISPLKRAPTLILPPIQSKKSDVEAKRS